MEVEDSGGGGPSPHLDVFDSNFRWVPTNIDDLSDKISLCKDEMGRLINHVFLPRKLPQSQLLDQTASDESRLLAMMTETVKIFQKNIPGILPTSTVRMFNTWDSLQCYDHLDENDIQKSIDSLEAGDMFALYIRKQNCGLVLSSSKEIGNSKRMFLSTFSASLSNERVTKSSGDLEVTFPHQSIHIPMSQILTSLAFAKQLATLHNTDFEKAMAETRKAGTTLSNCRDVADTIFVSEWLAATLADKDSANCSLDEFPKIVKKVRDEILLKKVKGLDTLFPFRRSGFWMTIKTALQLNLTHELGLRDGLFLYKMIMSQLMVTICRCLLTRMYGELDIDLTIQMLAKLARRLEKLDMLAERTTHASLLQTRQILHRETVKIIENIRKKIDTQYNSMLEIDKMECQLQALEKLDFENDIYHKAPNLKAHLARKGTSKYTASSGVVFKPQILGRCGQQFPPVHILLETDEITLGVALYDIENWIFQHLDNDTWDVTLIRDLAFRYSEKATEYYKNDHVGYSRMVLNFLKIIHVLDSKAVEKYPLLNEHRFGVNAEIISQLLLPRRKDLEYAHQFEEYFNTRNKGKMFPSLVEEDHVTEKSFSARYAEGNEEMCRKRDEILANAAQKVREKEAEVKILRKRVAVLELELIGMECEYVSRYNRRWKTFKEVHSNSCRKCAKEKEKNGCRVQIYEYPLRDEKYNQNAVVFELLIPIEIACLRDVLYVFSAEICQFSLTSTYSCENWKDNPQLSRYHRGQQQKTFLGSSNRSFSSTHFSTCHVDSSDSQIILRNSGSCTFFGKHKNCNTKLQSSSTEKSIKTFCTLQVESGSQYKELQWAVVGTSHSQNKVLASQSECPESLTLAEWNEFGSLRSGNRIQIRNIYRAIENGRLSFKNESVLMLILQALWEGGANTDFVWSRDAHVEFTDNTRFCEQFSSILDRFLNTQKNNWKQPYNLLTIIMITIRVLEINSDSSIVEVFTNLLIKCRNVAVEWMTCIEDVMKLSSNFDHCEKLRDNLVNVGICCALTFNVDPNLPCFSKILNYENDGLRIWILALVKIDNNITLSEHKDVKLQKQSIDYFCLSSTRERNSRESSSFTRRNFLRMIRNIGINIEGRLKEIIIAESFKSFNLLAREYFSADHNDTDRWEAHGTVFCKRTKDRNQIDRLIQVDLLQGKFLVDNLPVSRLPEAIVSSEVFQRVFGQTVLEVQPFGKDSFRTINKFNGCKYLFRVSDTVLITEERPDGHSYDLVPHTVLQNEVVHLLVENYCHWWCREKKIIEFKPLPFNLNGDDESLANDHHYILSLETYQLTDTESGRNIIDVKSNSFNRISNYLSRFELAKYIKIFLESKGEKYLATVELSRMRLKFKAVEMNQKIHLESNEYEGMRVSSQLKIDGCFTGLRKGLVLEDISGSQESFLVPHGEILAHAQGDGPQKVLISLEELREPKFFKFEVIHRLRQFKAGKSYSAWFYLAYLHGLTAQPLEDPFTGMTGTEQALDILSSPHCWSNEPFDDASLLIMASLSELTPKREHYNAGHIKSMQTVTFPTFLPPTAAHDLYLHIVRTLIKNSQILSCLFKPIHNGRVIKNPTTARMQRLSSMREPNFGYEDDLENESCSKLKRNIKGTDSALNLRAYRRHSCSNPNISVKKEFIETVPDFPFKDDKDGARQLLLSRMKRLSVSPSPRKCQTTESISHSSVVGLMRKFSALVHEQSYVVPTNSDQVLSEFITESSKFLGVSGQTFMGLRVDNWNLINLRDSFLDLYNFVRKMDKKDLNCEWPLFLNCLAFNPNNSVDALFILHTIAENPQQFQDLDAPKFSEYQDLEQYYCNEDTVQKIFQACPSVSESAYLIANGCSTDSYSYSYSSPEYKEYQMKRANLSLKYKRELKTESIKLMSAIKSAWPLDNCNSLNLSSEVVNVYEAIAKINPHLQKWNQNRQLILFFKGVWEKCNSLLVMNYPLDSVTFSPWIQNVTVQGDQKEKFQINFKEKMLKKFCCPSGFTNDVKKIYETGTLSCDYEFPKNVLPSDVPLYILQMRKEFFHEKSEEFSKLVETLTTDPTEVSHLVASGIYPRIVPVRMLSRLIPKISTKEKTAGEIGLENLIGACAVAWTYEQQAIRMIRFLQKINNFENSMRRELETIVEETNWSPKVHPEWLLFELEMNLKIRQIQVEVAERMIDPPGGRHSVMQLNMGEGKTAVIVPLLCLTLGDGESLCRVTVLKPLFRTNLAALRYCLGGLLNRRVYTFPCRRDMEIGNDEALKIMDAYKECLQERGIVMTLPEYILSFQLKMYETAQKNQISVASNLLKTHQWLQSHARDVLDESDEILHAKYQLIYTVGNKVIPGGGNLRWTVAQALLKLVPSKLKTLFEKHGVKSVEFDHEFEKLNKKEIFTPCRLLRDDIYQELIDALADDFVEGKTSIKFVVLKNSDKIVVKQFLTQRKIEKSVYEKFQRLFVDNLIHLDTVLIMAGYLKYEILRSALYKRWRVNYGVNPTGRLRMAVPFKAKDVAAEMTEFGHPDVAICLTQLSYYYSGLSDDQLMECFHLLEQMPNGNKYYESWIEKVKLSRPIDPTIENYEGLPLDDPKKREKLLFPILSKNMYVIDFWLGKTVFPKEARQFEKKLMASSWEICPEDKKLVVGFSGTNDSKNLLPGPIIQNDLPKLEKTNANVRKTLQQKENEGYLPLPANVTGKSIIQTLVAQEIPVLLDSGALMLELKNEEVAKHWLERIVNERKKKDKEKMKIEASVYFNDNDILMVKDLKNRDTELEQSPYKDRLDCCVVYLDDAHTRGTDLKFPVNTKACVTLGGGITRDKTVQACMRMRMLGNGHSVSFWASQEAHNAIVELCKVEPEEIKTDHVLKWIENNSKNFEKDGLVHWAAAGVSYAKKRAMHCLLSHHSGHLPALGLFCSDKEILELSMMFGSIKEEKLFTKIVETQFAAVIHGIKYIKDKNVLDGKKVGSARMAIEMTLKTKDEIITRLNDHIPNLTRFAEILDEEQEKELQEEKERNVEISVRPERKIPCDPKLDENVEKILRSGKSGDQSGFWNNSVIELSQVLSKYNLDMANFGVKAPSWGQKVFASKDFISVIRKTERYESYSYLSLFDRSYDRIGSGRRMIGLDGKKKLEAKDDSSFDITFLRPVVWIASVLYRGQMLLLLLSPHEANAYLPIFRDKNAVSTLHMYSPRLKLHQNSLINNTNLQVPAERVHFVDRHLQAQLSVFSGSLYFEEKEEQDEYCLFIGVIPIPRSIQHQADFENGLISQSGFVAPIHRRYVSRELYDKCKFQKCPDKMIRDIAENRHGFFPRSSHVSMLVLESKDMTCENNQ